MKPLQSFIKEHLYASEFQYIAGREHAHKAYELEQTPPSDQHLRGW